MPLNDLNEIREALETTRTIAVVGCSDDPSRPSNSIARYLIRAGYDVIPVNPQLREVFGKTCYPSLTDIPKEIRVDMVDVFRRSEFVRALAEETLARDGVRFFWMQDGVIDREAAKKLVDAGIGVAMDRCIYRDRESLVRV